MARRPGDMGAGEPDLARNPFGGGRRGGGGSGPTLATGGLNFDTSGITKFITEMRKARDVVKEFWRPFQEADLAQRRVNTFFDTVERRVEKLKRTGGGVDLAAIGGGGGAGGRGRGGAGGGRIGGDGNMPELPGGERQPRRGDDYLAPTSPRRQFVAYNYAGGVGASAYEARHLASQFQAGRQSPFLQGGLGNLSLGSIGGSALTLGRNTLAVSGVVAGAVRPQMQRALDADMAAQLALTAGGQSFTRAYRNQLEQTITQAGRGFRGEADRAAVANALTGIGMGITRPGGRAMFENVGLLGRINPMMSGEQLAGATTTIQSGGVAANLRAYGVSVSPGGRGRPTTEIFKDVTRVLFRGNEKPSADLVQGTVMLPGTPANLLLSQLFGGDDNLRNAYIQWLQASAQAGAPITGAQADQLLKRTGITQTGAATAQRRQEAGERLQSLLDPGMLQSFERVNVAATKASDALFRVGDAHRGFAHALGSGAGLMERFDDVMGGAVQTLLGILGASGIMRALGGLLGTKGAGGLANIGGGGGGGLLGGAANLLSKIPGVEVGGATGLLAAGGMALGGQVVGMIAEHQGGTGKGGKRWLGRDVGTVAKWTGTGAAVGSVVPVVGTAVGAAGGAVVGLGHTALRHLGILGDPVGTWGWRALTGDQGDPTSGSGALSTDLRGPGRTQGMDAGFLAKLRQMFSDNPRLILNSGFRTRAEQENLFKSKPKGMAARPGNSQHEKGLAADIGPPSEYGWLASNASRYGLTDPIINIEPWHWEPQGGRQMTGTAAATGAGGSGSSTGQGGGPRQEEASPPSSWLAPTLNLTPGFSSEFGNAQAASTAGTADKSGATGPVSKTSGSQDDVMRAILATGQALGVSPKVMLAAFETGFVESGMRNLDHGDRDSLGVFQQRPSQGWGTPQQVTDVSHAATSFFTRAMKGDTGNLTAGQLAQKVQRSAFPARYDQQRNNAASHLAALGYDVSGIGDPPMDVVSAPSMVPMPRRASAHRDVGGVPPVIIQHAEFKFSLQNGSPQELEQLARSLATLLGDRDRIMEVSGA